MEEQENVRWIPYIPPPQNRREHAWMMFRRYSFPAACVLAAGVLGFLMLAGPEKPVGEVVPGALDPFSAVQSSAQQQAASSLPGGEALISVLSRPSGATVLIDGDSVGTTPLNAHRMPAGIYHLLVQKERYAPVDSVVVLGSSEPPALFVHLEQQNPQEVAAAAQSPGPATGGPGPAVDDPEAGAPGAEADPPVEEKPPVEYRIVPKFGRVPVTTGQGAAEEADARRYEAQELARADSTGGRLKKW